MSIIIDPNYHATRSDAIFQQQRADKAEEQLANLRQSIADARQAAMDLCYQIEESGASEELTKAVVMASDLERKLNDMLP